jgi:hypothetical protein
MHVCEVEFKTLIWLIKSHEVQILAEARQVKQA